MYHNPIREGYKKPNREKLSKAIEQNLLREAGINQYQCSLLDINVSDYVTKIRKMADHCAETYIRNLNKFQGE